MKRSMLIAALLVLLTGCDNWGDYQYHSDKFKFDIMFPDKWEVWDKSDDARDYLVASQNDKINNKIEVTVVKTAPDLETNELYPSFESGNDDAATLLEFGVDEKGTTSTSNGEGRMIKVHWTGEKSKMRGVRYLFIGNRYLMTIKCESTEDDFETLLPDFTKMIRKIKL